VGVDPAPFSGGVVHERPEFLEAILADLRALESLVGRFLDLPHGLDVAPQLFPGLILLGRRIGRFGCRC